MSESFYDKTVARARATGVTPRRAMMISMLERLSSQDLPVQLAPAFDFAVEYWTSRGSLDGDDVHAWRSYVWSYLKAAFPGCDGLNYREGRLARAVLGVLHPEDEVNEDEADQDIAEWFDCMLEPLE